MSVDMDLQALVAGSESLLSHIARPDGIPRLNKSLAEIERGSLRMGAEATARSRREAVSLGVTAEVAEQKQELKGGSMLANNRFDPESLGRAIHAVQIKARYQIHEPLRETDIEGYLAHHHDMIVATAVDETRRAAEECSMVRQREWEVDSWRQTKKALMESRMDGGAGAVNGGGLGGVPFGSGAGDGVLGSGGAADTGRLHPAVPRADQSLAVYSQVHSAGIVPPVTDIPAVQPIASRLTALEADHADVIRQLNETDDEKFPIATKLAESAHKAVVAGTTSGPQFAYHNAWEILRTMLEGDGWESGVGSTPQSRLEGTLTFLEAQFQKVLEAKVKKAREAGKLDAASLGDTATGLQPKVRAYMRLQRIDESAAQGGPVFSGLQAWPQIFLCMRCGSRGDAADVAVGAAASSRNIGAQEADLLKIVAEELRASGKARGADPIITRAFESMRDGDDMYKRSVLNVLVRARDKAITRINKETIEDYMWFKLSFVGVDVESSEVLRAQQERVIGRDNRRRFDPDGNNPYAYVNVLLYTQQLEAVVSYLHWKGHHLAALHIAVALSQHKIYVGHDARTPTSAYPGDRSEPGPPPSLRELVECAMQGRLNSDPQVCAEYILVLPVAVAVECMSDLAVHIGAVAASKLLGYLKTNTDRQQGELDRFLNGETVEEIAFRAANKAEAQGRRADAITFYGLASTWTSVARLVGRELADRLRPNAENRDFWKDLGRKLFQVLQESTKGYDVDEARELAAEGVGQMLCIMDFFDFLYKQELFRALQELQRAGMLPSSQDDAARLASRLRLRGAEDALTALLPEVLQAGMQCLRHHHLDVKRELHGNPPRRIDVVEWRASREKMLAELENKGHAMVGLAGRLSDVLPSSFVADLSRLEANIVN